MKLCYVGKGYEEIQFPKKVLDSFKIRKLMKVNKEFKPDLIHFTEVPLTLPLAKILTKKKIVVTLESIPSNPVKKMFLGFCDGVIVPTHYHHSKIDMKKSKKVVIPMPIQAGSGPKNSELILDCTGSKNMERAMDLISGELPQYKLTRDKELMRESEVVFVGSHKNTTELQKAMSMGKVVIAIDSEGLGDYVTNKEDGLLTEDEPSKIADKILQVLTNDRLRHRIIERAEKNSRKWDYEHVRRKLERFYTYVLET